MMENESTVDVPTVPNLEIFEIWAPHQAFWSAWAKPVLFQDMQCPVNQSVSGFEALGREWDALKHDTAVILDLPGDRGVHMGMALIQKGFRPVPLYNSAMMQGVNALVEVDSIVQALGKGYHILKSKNLPDDAPPVFMLDSKRLDAKISRSPGNLDNRWMVLPQDFPSGNTVFSRGIREAWVVMENQNSAIKEDLQHVLLRWQQAGVQIKKYGLDSAFGPVTETIQKPSRFKSFAYTFWALILSGLSLGSAGGFGSVIPKPSSGRHG